MSTESNEIEPNERIDPREFRNTLGHFASGVTVITTELDGVIHGMTANAFLSVSLDPPLVAVSVDHRAQLHQLLRQTGRYGVSILRSSQQDLSTHFAGFGAQDIEVKFTRRAGLPLLENAVAYLVTRVVDAHPAGDHTLYIGQVEYLEYDGDAADPLLYYKGNYESIAKER
jgi:flavin reductase (DIM6/NTAB) family NADH-FMN oxidoreductase RutF